MPTTTIRIPQSAMNGSLAATVGPALDGNEMKTMGWAGSAWHSMGSTDAASQSDPDDDESDEDDDDDDEAPETPLDEPSPIPVQDPPAEPDQHPYTVRPNA
jgi:hypothetical protein